MNPYSDELRQALKALEGSEIYRAQKALRSIPNWMQRIREEQEKYFRSLSQSATSKWDIDSDPNVPAEFKRKYKSLLQAKPRRRKVFAIWSLVAQKNPETLGALLKALPKPDYYSIETNAIGQYLKLAEEHYRLGLGPVAKSKLWKRVCEVHVAYFQANSPTHRARILKKIGLGLLPEEPPGRPRK